MARARASGNWKAYLLTPALEIAEPDFPGFFLLLQPLTPALEIAEPDFPGFFFATATT